MHILYFSWEENCKIDMLDTLSRIDCQCSLITAPQNNYLYNPALQDTVYQAAINSHCDIIFSFNYLPIVAQAAERAKIPYVSWVYDCPHWSLFSPTICSPYNYIFLFDKEMVQQVKSNGAVNAFHLPLAVNIHRLAPLLEQSCAYDDVVSFVGSLYEITPTARYNTFQNIFVDILMEYLPPRNRSLVRTCYQILLHQKSPRCSISISDTTVPRSARYRNSCFMLICYRQN